MTLPVGCGRAGGERTARRPPLRQLIVVGIDGADWQVIRGMWSRGELPNLRRLAERGTQATLRTDYAMSPVIWTTVATGRLPREHGITGFVAPTGAGDVPVSSTMRRVPALWSMASAAGLSVAVVSWWSTWPAEHIHGVVVSDRAMLDVPDAIYPPSFAPRFAALRATALGGGDREGHPTVEDRDRVTAEVARAMAAARHDLVLAYFRGVDIASHRYWRYAFPAGFPPLPAGELAVHAAEVPRAYAAADEALGAIVAAAPRANVVVLSDHGFHRLAREQTIVALDFDRVLERLGYLRRDGDAIQWPSTRLYTRASMLHSQRKLLCYALAGRERNGTVRPLDRPALQAALERDLARVRWRDGGPVFRLRAAPRRLLQEGIDLVAVVQPPRGESVEVLLDGAPWPELGVAVSRMSGSHGEHTHGIFIAAGPDVVAGADLTGVHIHDVAPTVLYALGLPAGADMAGRARVELFTAEHRRLHPPRTIASWGKPRAGRALRSEVDAELVDELQAIGYLR